MSVAGSGQPEYMITGDASNANFASTQETTLAFLKCLEDYQDLFEYFLSALFNKVFFYAQKYGEAPDTFTDPNGEEIPMNSLVSVTFPETKPKDIEKLGRYLQTLQLMGIASDETLASMAGIDWQSEKIKLEKESLEGYPKVNQALRIKRAVEKARREFMAQTERHINTILSNYELALNDIIENV